MRLVADEQRALATIELIPWPSHSAVAGANYKQFAAKVDQLGIAGQPGL